MFGLFFERPTCPDGVEFVDDLGDNLEAPAQALPGFRYRSKRRRPLRLDISDLENPIILRFVNSRNTDALVQFFNRYGLLLDTDVSNESVNDVQRRCLDCLTRTGSGDPLTAMKAANRLLIRLGVTLKPTLDLSTPKGTARLALQPTVLFEFMVLEACMVAVNGARLAFCQHCRSAFVTGPMTGRRSHAKFCSDRCRVAAMRQRNAGRE